MRFTIGLPNCIQEYYRELEETGHGDYLREKRALQDENYQPFDLYEVTGLADTDKDDELECEETCGIVDDTEDNSEEMPF